MVRAVPDATVRKIIVRPIGVCGAINVRAGQALPFPRSSALFMGRTKIWPG
jgi:hypothetical protein